MPLYNHVQDTSHERPQDVKREDRAGSELRECFLRILRLRQPSPVDI
jgi:hypothetical protein